MRKFSPLVEILHKPIESLSRTEMWALYLKFVDNFKERKRINSLIQKEEGLAMASNILQQIVIRSMLDSGVSVDFIAQAMKTSPADVKKMLENS